MNIVKKPDSQRGPQLARSAKAMRRRDAHPPSSSGSGRRRGGLVGAPAGTPAVSSSSWEPLRNPRDSSPWLESTRDGSRIAQTVPSTKIRKVSRSDHLGSGPIREASPASGAATAAPTTPAIEVRALAFTSVRPSGRIRGTAAARVTL